MSHPTSLSMAISMAPRKFYQEDLKKYFLVEPLETAVVDPGIAHLLKDYDVSRDSAFSEPGLEKKIELYAP